MSDNHRRTGRTFGMLNIIADTLQDGQPKVIVFFANMRHVDGEIPALMEAISRRGLSVNRRRKYWFDVDGCELLIRPISDYEIMMCGQVPCEFIDHYALEVCDRRTLDLIRYNESRAQCYTGQIKV